MAFEQKDNTGVMFPNTQKKNSAEPDWRGTFKIDGVEKEVSVWKKKTKTGDSYYSFSFQIPGQYQRNEPKQRGDLQSDEPW